MKINFNGHTSSTRETEISQKELAEIFEVMKQKFLDHIEYGTVTVAYRENLRVMPESLAIHIPKDCIQHFIDALEQLN